MKKLNNYLLLLAAAVFTFTACEKDIEREPSPTVPEDVVAFSASSISADVNPNKSALQYEVGLYRTSTKEAASVAIHVLSGDIDIIKVPASVSFAAGEANAKLLLEFPDAQIDSTYSVLLEVDSLNQSPYFTGGAKCEVTIAIALWEPAPAEKKAIFFDGIIGSPYGLDPEAFYVSYELKENSDGSKDYRFLNPYNRFEKAPKADQFNI